MREYFIKDPTALKMIDAAYLSAKEKLKYVPIRGGTDGATITYMGLPCPNLGVGDFYPHGRYEFISLTQMKKMVDILGELFKGDDLK
jgi:tripeptide aminopeptidase